MEIESFLGAPPDELLKRGEWETQYSAIEGVIYAFRLRLLIQIKYSLTSEQSHWSRAI